MRILSLPIYYDLKIDEQKKVINALNKISLILLERIFFPVIILTKSKSNLLSI